MAQRETKKMIAAIGNRTTTCQIVLIGVGKFEALARRASMTLAGMVLVSALMVRFQWSSDAFVVAYVIVYGAGSLFHAECLYSLIRSLRRRAARAWPSENIEASENAKVGTVETWEGRMWRPMCQMRAARRLQNCLKPVIVSVGAGGNYW